MGRFLTRDTYTGEDDEPLSLHLYTYCENDGVNAWDPSGHRRKKAWVSSEKGEVYSKTKLKELRICVDGRVSNKMKKTSNYGDEDHDDELGAFNKENKRIAEISSDQVPFIVIPVVSERTKKVSVDGDLKKYKYSVAVIINKEKRKKNKNLKRKMISKGDYLYCVVADTNDMGLPLREVSIYAAWKMVGATEKEKIGNDTQKGKWEMKLFASSSPNADATFAGWKTNSKKLRKQIIKYGKQCYKGTGKCLNYKTPKYIK